LRSGPPDWPKCFGRWIPPFSIDQLPEGIDPSTFNVTLAWIEYFNRLVGVTVGFLIVITAILAIRHYRKVPTVLYPSLASAVLVAFQGWFGSVVVSSELEPFIVTVHMLLALIIVSLLIYATLRSYSADTEAAPPNKFPTKLRSQVGLIWLLTIIQVIIGSQVREALETVAARYPRWTGDQWFGEVGVINDLHFILGIAVAALTVYVGLIVLRIGRPAPSAIKLTVWSLIGLVVLQAGSGIVLQVSSLPPLTDLFHLWMAGLSIGLQLVLYTLMGRSAGESLYWHGSYARVIRNVAVAMILLGVMAYFVIERAEQSRACLPHDSRTARLLA
jgi:cytochrome c oxidase assembly protein subunit 15